MSGGANASALGHWGEDFVVHRLEEEGCKIAAVRWRCPRGELDIVAEDGKYLRLVEVKLRRNVRSVPREAVDARKQDKLRRAAEWYLQAHPTHLQPRFDVAEVYAPAGMATVNPVIHYITNAFW